MKQFVKLKKLSKGDQVAVLSPSAGLPGLFPWVQDLGIERIKNEFGLIPKEYPTTRQMGSSLEDRAKDIMEAFADPENKAIITSIGGEDQLKLLKYLDGDIIKNNPKPFFGYSDNTHLVQYLWSLGIPAYYGGAVMTQFAMQNKMHDFTKDYLKKALFESGEIELQSSKEFTDVGLDWSDQSNLAKSRVMEANGGWLWDGQLNVEGILWGGCVESIVFQMSSNVYLPTKKDLQGTVLFLETAEDIPDAWIVEYVLAGMGERGWFSKDGFQAVLVGRPKAWEFDKPNSPEQKKAFKEEQQKVVVNTVREYNKSIPIIQNLDFGHTDPQFPIPSGQSCRIDSAGHKIFLTF